MKRETKLKMKINHPETNKRGEKISNEEIKINAYNEIELTYEIMVLTRRIKTMPKVHTNGIRGTKKIKSRLELLKRGVEAYESGDEIKIKEWRNENMSWLRSNRRWVNVHFPNRNLNYK